MSRDAGALHCPNCGGPAAAGDASCKYCHAQLATVSCPHCFALMFVGAGFCPHCGARAQRAAKGVSAATCPGCRGVMREIDLGATALLECAACHGMWIDADTFERICADREAQAALLHQWPTASAPTAANVRYRPCLTCGKMMNRLNFGRLSGTVVDVCKGHGTFLDAGELHQIVRFIQGGGLDRARQRQLEDIKEEARRLRAAQQAQGMRDLQTGDAWSAPSSWNSVDLMELLKSLKR
jgi:Zn-finger nucleic acid-binding protein